MVDEEKQSVPEGGNIPEEANAPVTPGQLAEEVDTVESLKRVLDQEKAKAERYLANWQRAQADFINLKRRTEQERTETAQFANARLILSVLPILDDFERALRAISPVPEKCPCKPRCKWQQDGEAWIEGIRLIRRKLQATLEAQGLSEIEAVGREFDPDLHEAVMYVPDGEGKVIEEVRKGYKLHDRVIRPTMVKVGRRQEIVPQEGGAKPPEEEGS